MSDEAAAPSGTLASLDDRWIARENKLMDEIAQSIVYYGDQAETHRRWQRPISILVMVLGVMAPMVVVGSGASAGALGFSADSLNKAGIVITFSLAILEGLRRIFRFDRRWAECYNAKNALKRARERYRIDKVGIPIGNDAWRNNLARLRTAYDEITGSETNAFFAAVQAVRTETDIGKQETPAAAPGHG